MLNREKILTSALELFYARGYDAVGIQEIVDAAGVTKPTMYYYFGSKRGLLETLVHERYGRLKEEIDRAAVYNGDLPETLFQVAKAFFAVVCANRKAYRLVLALYYTGQENEGHRVVSPLVTRYYERLVELFVSASRELGNMNGRQKQFALGFMGLLDTTFLLICSQVAEEAELLIGDTQIRGLVKQFMYGIYS